MGCLSSFWPEHCTGLARPCYNTVKGGKQMETVYFDAPKDCIGIALSGKQVVYTGLEIHREPVRYRGCQALAPFLKEDFHFYFEDEEPQIPIYAVPQVLILGHDSDGGWFASTRMDVRLEEDFPLFYISREGRVYQVEGESSRLLTGTFRWRECLRPSDAVKLYPSRAMARRDFEIHDLAELDLPGLPGQAKQSRQTGQGG